MITIVCKLMERKIGDSATSPGLEYDAKVYFDVLSKKGFKIQICNSWYKTEKERTENIKKIVESQIIIGIEELGSSDYHHYYKSKYIILIPNLEIDTPYIKNMYANLPKLDLIVGKFKDNDKFIDLLKNNLVKYKKLCNTPSLIYIPHITPVEICKNDKNIRKNIIHFVGSSPYKNTLEQTIAGIKLVKKYPEMFDKLIVKITFWKNDKFHPDFPYYTDSELDKLALEHPNEFLYMKNGFISDEEKYKLFDSSCLSLCCSNTEGFGHYIMESLARGCVTITTDGFPMNLIDGLLLVKPTREIIKGCGIYYSVDENDIYEKIVENIDLIKNYSPKKYIDLFKHQTDNFNIGIDNLTEILEGKMK